ncbi:hypothetical protein G3A43_08250 [Paraburkholderia aspalathi]|nr:hypothetical protein [Paraburkholderia aspalathi]MBK3780247.1 hypothetical protein [Paraburkholderia aspalathi]
MSFRAKVGAVGVWLAAGGLVVIGCLTGAVHPPAVPKKAELFAMALRTPAARAVATMEADWRIPGQLRPALESCGCKLGKLPG